MGGCALARSHACLLPAHGSQAGQADRGGGHRTQARHDHLAHADERRGLHLATAGAACPQVSQDRAQSGLAARARQASAAYDYNIPEKRAAERVRVEKAEEAYADFTARWRTKPRARSRYASTCFKGLFYNIRAGRLAGAAEVEDDIMPVSPKIEILRYELRSLIDPDPFRPPYWAAICSSASTTSLR
jgi:hypothetical protein